MGGRTPRMRAPHPPKLHTWQAGHFQAWMIRWLGGGNSVKTLFCNDDPNKPHDDPNLTDAHIFSNGWVVQTTLIRWRCDVSPPKKVTYLSETFPKISRLEKRWGNGKLVGNWMVLSGFPFGFSKKMNCFLGNEIWRSLGFGIRISVCFFFGMMMGSFHTKVFCF